MSVEREPARTPIAPLGGSPRGPSAGIALVLIAAAVAGAIVLAIVSSPQRGPSPSLALASPSIHAPTRVARLSPRRSAPPAAPSGTILVLRGVTDPGGALAALAGCSPLRRVAGQAPAAIKGSDVDATAEAAGRATGWLFVPPGIQAVTRVWLGDDVIGLAVAAGRPAVAVGRDGEVWLGGPSGAVRWQPIATPAGRTAWLMTADEVTARGRCGPWPVPPAIAGQRSLTCAGIAAPACLALAARVVREVRDLAYAGGDLALAQTGCGPFGPTCPEAHEDAAATPPGWAGGFSDVRAAEAPRPGAAFASLVAGILPDEALAAIASPSLPLPVAGGDRLPASCASTLEGDLRAAPWDRRVAWVGGTSVVWPAGSSVRFSALRSLAVPTPDGTVRLVAGAGALLRGSRDPKTGAFDACSAQSVSVTAAVSSGGPSGG